MHAGVWTVPALLVVLALVPSVAGVARVVELARGGPITPGNARFFAMPLPVVLHIVTAIPFAVLGALQFSSAWRRRAGRWHELTGRILVPLALMAALSGLWMTLWYPWPEADGIALYLMRLFFGTAMAVAVVMGVAAIRRRDFAAHGAWMTPAYAIGMGAGTQVLTHLPWFVLVGAPSEGPRAVMMAAGWMSPAMGRASSSSRSPACDATTPVTVHLHLASGRNTRWVVGSRPLRPRHVQPVASRVSTPRAC
jgi:uncharacterized membrane protein